MLPPSKLLKPRVIRVVELWSLSFSWKITRDLFCVASIEAVESVAVIIIGLFPGGNWKN